MRGYDMTDVLSLILYLVIENNTFFFDNFILNQNIVTHKNILRSSPNKNIYNLRLLWYLFIIHIYTHIIFIPSLSLLPGIQFCLNILFSLMVNFMIQIILMITDDKSYFFNSNRNNYDIKYFWINDDINYHF